VAASSGDGRRDDVEKRGGEVASRNCDKEGADAREISYFQIT